jgi:hypothetical protein
MRAARLVLSFLFILSSSPRLNSQQSTAPAPQASTLLSSAFAALVGNQSVQDVTLTGTARRIAGPDDESGTVVLKATSDGHSRMDLNLSGGTRSEIRSLDSSGNPLGAWSGPDGVQHAISFHNLLTDSSWFFSGLTLAHITSSQSIVETYIGQETLNGQAVLHISIVQSLSNSSGQTATLLQHLTQMDIFLDPTTHLPAATSISIHPDNDAGLDIPVQIQFSNYQSVNGVQIPFHIQKFINNSLALDLQVQSAALNSGLSASAFAIQVAQ